MIRLTKNDTKIIKSCLKSFIYTKSSATLLNNARSKYTLPDLPYDYNALEPFISGQIMELHHSKHHNTYVNTYNQLIDKYQESVHQNNIKQQLDLLAQLNFNGGGHINHSFFWKCLSPQKEQGGKPLNQNGELFQAIKNNYGSIEDFIKTFNAKTAAVQGSGWGWLGLNKETKSLQIMTKANQDPLTGIDVWEHAYYLQYKNVRAEYLKQIWNVINWKFVEDNYNKAIQE